MDHTSIASQSQAHVDLQSKIDDLLGGPLRRQVIRDVEVDDASSSVRENHEAVQQSERGRGHDEEVDGD